MIQKIKAFAADIDMTLSDKGDPLPDITKKALIELHNRKILLGLATGREITDTEKNRGKIWELPFEFDFVVGMNGGMVYDRIHDHSYSMDMMSVEETKDILTYLMPLINEHEIAVNAEGNGLRNAMNIGPELIESAKRHGFFFVDKTGDIDGFCEKPIYKLLFRTTQEVSPTLRKMVHDRYHDKYQTVETFPGSIEIMYSGIDKGSGMQKYCDWNNIDIKEVIAFGDNENDNSLLQKCGWGICLKDGNENTKKIANDVTDYGCKEGGLGHYIFDHVLKNL